MPDAMLARPKLAAILAIRGHDRGGVAEILRFSLFSLGCSLLLDAGLGTMKGVLIEDRTQQS